MAAILRQLELDQTFFIQLAVFAGLYLILAPIFFKPFIKLFEARHQRTVEDREAAERLAKQAAEKLDEYRAILAAERKAARDELEKALLEARKEESAILSQSRDRAKAIVTEAVESVDAQREELKQRLDSEIDGFSKQVAEKLLALKH